jgi:hypothetical protein
MQSLSFAPCFTSTIGAPKGLVDFWMTPYFSIPASSFSTNSWW